jgi:aromatic-L-amino-acid decarboxylase
MRWFCDLFGLPETSTGLVTTGGSMATLTALVAARDDRLDGSPRDGTVYVTAQTHFCVARAARIAGIPAEHVRVVPTRGLRMDPAAAADMIEADRARHLRPFLLVGTAGTTSSGTVDPLATLAGIARAEGLWFHVDAAYGGGFQLTSRGRACFGGIEQADSIVLDPHKALFLQYGTGLLLVRHRRTLAAAFTDRGDYVQDIQSVDGLPDYGFLGPELTREFRGARLWLPLHLHGVAAFRDMLDEKLDLADLAYQRLTADGRFDVPWPPDLTVLNFRLRAGSRAAGGPTRRLLDRVNATRRAFLSSTRIDGEWYLRLNASSHRTRAKHLHATLDLLTE